MPRVGGGHKKGFVLHVIGRSCESGISHVISGRPGSETAPAAHSPIVILVALHWRFGRYHQYEN